MKKYTYTDAELNAVLRGIPGLHGHIGRKEGAIMPSDGRSTYELELCVHHERIGHRREFCPAREAAQLFAHRGRKVLRRGGTIWLNQRDGLDGIADVLRLVFPEQSTIRYQAEIILPLSTGTERRFVAQGTWPEIERGVWKALVNLIGGWRAERRFPEIVRGGRVDVGGYALEVSEVLSPNP